MAHREISQSVHGGWLSVIAVLSVFVGSDECFANAAGELPAKIRFGEHIRPIFTRHCTACHGGVKQAGELSFVYRDKVLPPDGWVIEPGDPEASVLLDRVTSADPDEVMPPPEHGKPLSSRETALLRQWIQEGAEWDEHWAYVRPQAAPLPFVKNAGWVRNPIDQFVLAEIEENDLEPSPEAPAHRWLRRVTLDLIGLPPTPDERLSFERDVEERGDEAYSAVVDRLLQSPHFGERWAAPWLDSVRYADSKGLGADGTRTIWKYRDWVIRALNSDLPFDEFTRKQIAGDLQPQPEMDDLIATAVHRLTQTNEEGGTDDEEFRVAAVLDRVNTTWQTWQGVTFGCVQCHSHPYAPIEHEEYYRFAAFFNNTQDCDLNEDWPLLQAPTDPEDYSRGVELDRKIGQLRNILWEQEDSLRRDEPQWRPLNNLTAESSNATRLSVETVDGRDEYHTVGTVSRNTDIALSAPVPDSMERLTAFRLTIKPLNPEQAVSDSEWGFVLSQVTAELLPPGEDPRPLKIARIAADDPDPFYDPQASLDPKSNRGFAAFTRIHYPRQAVLILENPVELTEGAALRVTLRHRVYLLAAFSLIARRGAIDITDDERWTQLLTAESVRKQRRELAELQKQRRAIKSVPVPVLKQRPPQFERPTHVFERGLFLTKAQKVSAGVPRSFPPLPDGPVDRRTLAEWFVSPENPLTARVAVNRLWGQLFGTGIVATQEDFGSSGEPPSHPELLDFLALRYQGDLKWSTKALLREMVLSATYRQSSRLRPEAAERDPENRLLTRGPRHRLSAETVRDQALALSGLLSVQQFGPPVRPPIPEGVWRPFSGGDKWNTPASDHPDRYRRSIYTYTKRSIPYPMFAAFDAPSREFCAPRRLRSNTPLQALMTLNDTTFLECARALAARMRAAAKQPEDQIAFGLRLVVCREPRDGEVADLMQLYQRAEEETENAAVKALQPIAVVLLNLDEVLTR